MAGIEDRIKKCPMCGKETLWDEMIWLNGECTCPTCYGYKRRALDRVTPPSCLTDPERYEELMERYKE